MEEERTLQCGMSACLEEAMVVCRGVVPSIILLSQYYFAAAFVVMEALLLHTRIRARTRTCIRHSCSIDILARRRDDLNDEILRLKHEKRNSAYQTSLIEELDSKHDTLVSTCLMLQYDANAFGLPRSSLVRLFLVRLTDSREFRAFVFSMILCNCAILALDSPPRSGRERLFIDLIQVLVSKPVPLACLFCHAGERRHSLLPIICHMRMQESLLDPSPQVPHAMLSRDISYHRPLAASHLRHLHH